MATSWNMASRRSIIYDFELKQGTEFDFSRLRFSVERLWECADSHTYYVLAEIYFGESDGAGAAAGASIRA